MEQKFCTVISNEKIARGVYKLALDADGGMIERPGQFVKIGVPGFFLKRPMSVCDFENGVLTVIYKVLGKGTDALTKVKINEKLEILMPLGNGFEIEQACKRTALFGGGVGLPPMYFLAKALLKQGKEVEVLAGFNCGDEVFLVEELKDLGCKVQVATMDGACGQKGTVTSLQAEYDYFYACGPTAMLKAVSAMNKIPGQLSLEERMGCGFGACMGCSIMTAAGAKRVCKEGPVFYKEDLIW